VSKSSGSKRVSSSPARRSFVQKWPDLAYSDPDPFKNLLRSLGIDSQLGGRYDNPIWRTGPPETIFLNFWGVQESALRNRFHQPMLPGGIDYLNIYKFGLCSWCRTLIYTRTSVAQQYLSLISTITSHLQRSIRCICPRWRRLWHPCRSWTAESGLARL
jgi:hypothetical protein